MAVSENTRKVLAFLKTNPTTNPVTAADIAEAIGIPVKSVNGCVTAGLQKKGFSVRTEAEVQVEVTAEDGTTSQVAKKVKFITLTPAGLAYDPDAVAPAAE